MMRGSVSWRTWRVVVQDEQDSIHLALAEVRRAIRACGDAMRLECELMEHGRCGASVVRLLDAKKDGGDQDPGRGSGERQQGMHALMSLPAEHIKNRRRKLLVWNFSVSPDFRGAIDYQIVELQPAFLRMSVRPLSFVRFFVRAFGPSHPKAAAVNATDGRSGGSGANAERGVTYLCFAANEAQR